MYNFCIDIPDSVSTCFKGKLEAAKQLGIYNIETSDVFNGKHLYEMNGEETEVIRDLLIDYGMKIVLISTDLDSCEKEKLKLFFRQCQLLKIEAVKVGDDVSDFSYFEKLSECYSIRLYIENKADGKYKSETELYEAVKGESKTGIIFNPYEFVCTERHPFFHAYYGSKIKNDIGFLRINDGLYRTHEKVELSHGCAEVKELASIMLARSYKGYFSFTPYLDDMSIDGYEKCIATFKNHLKRM